MSIMIPLSLQPFVKQELKNGAFTNETELVAKALELYRDMKARHEHLRSELQGSLKQADAGEVAVLDMDSIKNSLPTDLDESDLPS